MIKVINRNVNHQRRISVAFIAACIIIFGSGFLSGCSKTNWAIHKPFFEKSNDLTICILISDQNSKPISDVAIKVIAKNKMMRYYTSDSNGIVHFSRDSLILPLRIELVHPDYFSKLVWVDSLSALINIKLDRMVIVYTRVFPIYFFETKTKVNNIRELHEFLVGGSNINACTKDYSICIFRNPDLTSNSGVEVLTEKREKELISVLDSLGVIDVFICPMDSVLFNDIWHFLKKERNCGLINNYETDSFIAIKNFDKQPVFFLVLKGETSD